MSILADTSSRSFEKAALSVLARKSSRTIGATFSAGCVPLSSSRRTQPLTMISGPVEQSSATSTVFWRSASAIGALQASRSVTFVGSMP